MRRRDDDFPLPLRLGELLLDRRDIAVDFRQTNGLGKGQLPQRALQLGELTLKIGLIAFQCLELCGLVEPVLLGRFKLWLCRQSPLSQRPQPVKALLAEPNKFLLETDLFGEMVLLGSQCRDPRREVSGLLLEQLALDRLLTGQALATRLQALNDLFLDWSRGLAVQLCGKHHQRRAGLYACAFLDLDLGDDPLLGRRKPNNAAMRHEPAADAFLARIAAQ